jgi:hypothetical protein
MTQDHNHLSHATWECKCRLRAEVPQEGLFGQIGRHPGSVFPELAHQAARNFLGHKFWASSCN